MIKRTFEVIDWISDVVLWEIRPWERGKKKSVSTRDTRQVKYRYKPFDIVLGILIAVFGLCLFSFSIYAAANWSSDKGFAYYGVVPMNEDQWSLLKESNYDARLYSSDDGQYVVGVDFKSTKEFSFLSSVSKEASVDDMGVVLLGVAGGFIGVVGIAGGIAWFSCYYRKEVYVHRGW